LGPLVPWSLGPLVLWSLGPLGPSVPWSFGPLVLWSFGLLVPGPGHFVTSVTTFVTPYIVETRIYFKLSPAPDCGRRVRSQSRFRRATQGTCQAHQTYLIL